MLNIEQFQRFMAVIRKLGDRVEKEHNQFLRDSQRLEDRSATTNGVAPPTLNSSLNFESLVGRANTSAVKVDAIADNQNGWDDDVWGAILNDGPEVRASNDFQSCIVNMIGRYRAHNFLQQCRRHRMLAP